MDWQPISTVPKDGTDVLVCVTFSLGGGEWETAMWVDSCTDRYEWPNYDRRIDLLDLPTHWQPLPKPPTVQ